MQWLERQHLQILFDHLIERGYEIYGPRVEQAAIVYDRLQRASDLPSGWTDEQSPGHYRLKRRDDAACFGYVIGPHSWKKYLFPPLLDLLKITQSSGQWQVADHVDPIVKRAFLGVRACEVSAIAIQDRVFLSEDYTDPTYASRRKNCLIVAVNCTQAAETCFCTSMGTGPACQSGFDLALTEMDQGFVVDIGSPQGAEVAAALPLRPASADELEQAAQLRQQAVNQITRRLETNGLRDHLMAALEHPHWNDVAQRCLSCSNCTLVCPTCFCHSVSEVSDLTQDKVVRQRHWDSCFNFDFSHVAGGAVRDTTRSRYRQWLTHKLASWIDQFGTSGCVGCGRCITWCPVGIDITQEAAALCREPDVMDTLPDAAVPQQSRGHDPS